VATLIYAEPLIYGWVGEQYDGAVTPTRLFAVWVALGALDAVGTTMLISAGRLRPIVWLSLVWVAANLALSIALVHVWGVSGVVAATVITYVPLLAAYTVISLRQFDVAAGIWLRRVVVPVLPAVAVQLALGLALMPLLDGLPPLLHVAIGGFAGVAAAIALYVVVIGRAERAYLFATLRIVRAS
jgi:O-antigen/teichoic acid export membrane protein